MNTLTVKTPSYMHAIILGLFCLGFGLLLAVINSITAEDIAARALEDRQNSLAQVIPERIRDNNPVLDTVVMKNDQGREITVYHARKNGRVTGVAYEVFGSGYAGQIKLMMGVDDGGKIIGVRVLAHKETPGLGDKIETKKGNWILGFDGLSLTNPVESLWKVKKDGGQFDQFAGATITPRGVVRAVHEGLAFYAAHKAQLTETY